MDKDLERVVSSDLGSPLPGGSSHLNQRGNKRRFSNTGEMRKDLESSRMGEPDSLHTQSHTETHRQNKASTGRALGSLLLPSMDEFALPTS